MTSIANPPIDTVSPRTAEAIAALQTRRNQAAIAKNEAESALIFARRDLYLATQRHDVANTLRFTRAYQTARSTWESASADFEAVVTEIQELIAAETAEVAA